MSSLAFAQSNRDPKRLLAISVVVALHAGAIYGMMQWGVRPPVQSSKAPVQVTLVAEEAEQPRDVQPPSPKWVSPIVEIAPPVINLQFADPAPTISVAYKSESAPAEPAPQTAVPKMVSTVEYLRPLKPRYPPTSRRLREEGMVVLLVLVNEEGKASRVEVRNSSGFVRLDRAAQEAAECALFKPYLENGIARPALVLIPVEFTLSQRVAQR